MASATSTGTSGQPKDWSAILEHWKNLAGLTATLITALPLTGFAVGQVLPPGQDKILPVVTVVLSLIFILVLYYKFRDKGKTAFERPATWFVVVGAFWLVVYVCLMLSRVSEVDEKGFVTGFSLTPEAKTAIKNREVTNDTPNDLLDYFGHNSADRVWDWRWLVAALLFFSFCGMFVFTAGGLFLFSLKVVLHDQGSTPASAGTPAAAAAPTAPTHPST